MFFSYNKYLVFIFYFIFMTLYVGNIAFSVSNEELAQVFSAYGEVTKSNIVIDRETGRSRGFAFVEMATQAAGDAAIEGTNGALVKGRNLRVNEARERENNYSNR